MLLIVKILFYTINVYTNHSMLPCQEPCMTFQECHHCPSGSKLETLAFRMCTVASVSAYKHFSTY